MSNKLDVEKAIQQYRNLLSCVMIAKTQGVSRQAVFAALKKAGISTQKGPITIQCSVCKTKLKRTKSKTRGAIHNFCGQKCYLEFTKTPKYQSHRINQNTAKRELEKTLGVNTLFIAYHRDGDESNNEPKNLIAFHSNSDLQIYRRGGKVEVFILEESKWQETTIEVVEKELWNSNVTKEPVETVRDLLNL
jgi:YHS domain-containing protein